MKTTRKRYSADFKAKVALEAIRGETFSSCNRIAQSGNFEDNLAARSTSPSGSVSEFRLSAEPGLKPTDR